MNKDKIVTLIRKKNLDYNPSMFVTPYEDHYDWNDAIYEARERGICIAAFGDTLDKFVITPADLGYDFDYVFGRGSWACPEDCHENMSSEERIEVYNLLVDIAKVLDKYCKVSMVFIDADGKGYLITEFRHANTEFRYKYACDEDVKSVTDSYNIVLFCYSKPDELINAMEYETLTKKQVSELPVMLKALYEFLKKYDMLDEYDIKKVDRVFSYTKELTLVDYTTTEIESVGFEYDGKSLVIRESRERDD